MIYVEVEQDSLAYVRERLGSKADKAPIAVRNAANDTAVWARVRLLREAQSRYTVKSTGFKRSADIKRATLSTLTSEIRVKGKTLRIVNFKTTAPKSGVKAQVLTGEALKMLLYGGKIKAFRTKVATGYKNVNGTATKADKKTDMVLQRQSSKRLPVKAIHGPSVPKMIEKVYSGGRVTDEGLKRKIDEMFQTKLNYQIERILSQE